MKCYIITAKNPNPDGKGQYVEIVDKYGNTQWTNNGDCYYADYLVQRGFDNGTFVDIFRQLHMNEFYFEHQESDGTIYGGYFNIRELKVPANYQRSGDLWQRRMLY